MNLTTVFLEVFSSSVTAGILVFVLLGLKRLFGNKISPFRHHAVWLVVIACLLLPFFGGGSIGPLARLKADIAASLQPASFRATDIPAPGIMEKADKASEAARSFNLWAEGTQNKVAANLRAVLRIGSLVWLIGMVLFGLITAAFAFRVRIKLAKSSRRVSSFEKLSITLAQCRAELRRGAHAHWRAQ